MSITNYISAMAQNITDLVRALYSGHNTAPTETSAQGNLTLADRIKTEYNPAIADCLQRVGALKTMPHYERQQAAQKLYDALRAALVNPERLNIEVTPRDSSKKLRLARVTPDPDEQPDLPKKRPYAVIRDGGVHLTERTCEKLEQRGVFVPEYMDFSRIQKIKVVEPLPTVAGIAHYAAKLTQLKEAANYARRTVVQYNLRHPAIRQGITAAQLDALKDPRKLLENSRAPTQPELDPVKQTMFCDPPVTEGLALIERIENERRSLEHNRRKLEKRIRSDEHRAFHRSRHELRELEFVK